MIIYLLDSNGFYLETKQVDENYELGLNETTIVPDFKPNNRSRFDGIAWHDYSETAYMHSIPALTNEKRIIPEVPKPVANPEQKMIAKLGADVAQTQSMVAKLATLISPQGETK